MTAQRFALIGAAGYIAPRHMRAVRDLGHRLALAMDPNDSVGVIDSLAPDAEFHTAFETFIERAHQLGRSPETRIGWVSVCSPNDLHHAHIAAGLRLGADVICEKPLVPTLALVDELQRLERETGRRVWNILQLRHHPAILALRDRVAAAPAGTVFDVELTYITSRGPWYSRSWKGDLRRSGGVATNIGVHFFDMLGFVFGPLQSSTVHLSQDHRAAGVLVHERARVRWFLSIDAADLPPEAVGQRTTHRSLTIAREAFEFSDGFTDLHTTSYQEILAGRGYGLDAVRPCIAAVEAIRQAPVETPVGGDAHPMAVAAPVTRGAST